MYVHNAKYGCMSKQTPLEVLSPYEASIIRGTRGSKADLIVKEQRTKAVLDNMLGLKTKVLIDGTEVEATIEEILVASAISEELAHPKGLETIERLAKIRGEISDKPMEVNVSLVDSDLAKRALQ